MSAGGIIAKQEEEIDRLTAEHAKLQNDFVALIHQRAERLVERDRLTAEVERLRGALEEIARKGTDDCLHTGPIATACHGAGLAATLARAALNAGEAGAVDAAISDKDKAGGATP